MFQKNSLPSLSVIVPIYNEAGNVALLHQELVRVLTPLPHTWEIIFVDDGSTDATLKKSQELRPLKLVALRKNYGQTAAFDAGFKNATGDIFVTMDGDLQNDPADIIKLLAKIEEGFDVVSGWRKNRKDTWSKKITSRVANQLRKFFFNDTIHDSGCALKAYRRECFEEVDLYGEMHRFIPAILAERGFKITEVVVNHRPRIHGSSKYGNVIRGFKSLVDMIFVSFWTRYSARSLHILGGFGMILIFLGISLLMGLFALRFFFEVSLANRIWPLIAVTFVLTGIQFFTIGIVTDLLAKTYYKVHNRMNYSVHNIHENV